MKKARRGLPFRWEPLAALALLLAAWELGCRLGRVPAWALPAPSAVALAFPGLFPAILPHLAATLAEALVGFGIAVAAGLATALALHRFPKFDAAARPLLVVSQTVPLIALAPLFALWLGFGAEPKIVVVALGCYFPVAISAAEAFRAVDEDYGALLSSFGSSATQRYLRAILPGSASGIVAGLKLAAAYSITGAVVAEWLGGSRGLGIFMLSLKKGYSTDRLFGTVIIIIASSLALWGAVSLAGRLAFPWISKDRAADANRKD